MIPFVQGTLIISNIILIFLAIIYGFLIVEKKKREESGIWIYFLIASGIFFLSELVTFLQEFMGLEGGLIKNVLQISFGIIVLLAFITKYSSIEGHHRK